MIKIVYETRHYSRAELFQLATDMQKADFIDDPILATEAWVNEPNVVISPYPATDGYTGYVYNDATHEFSLWIYGNERANTEYPIMFGSGIQIDDLHMRGAAALWLNSKCTFKEAAEFAKTHEEIFSEYVWDNYGLFICMAVAHGLSLGVNPMFSLPEYAYYETPVGTHELPRAVWKNERMWYCYEQTQIARLLEHGVDLEEATIKIRDLIQRARSTPILQ